MFLKIITYPDKILREKNEEVRDVNGEIKHLALNMIETMKKADGVGLAAPQIGVNKRIIVVDWKDDDLVLINPKIKKKSWGKDIATEGCLSFPGFETKVKRSKKVTVSALDYLGKPIKIETEGLPARILQHEIDHLNGILIIDKATKEERKKYKQP